MKFFTVALFCAVFAITNVFAGPDFVILRKIYNGCLEKEGFTNSQVVQLAKAGKFSKIMCVQACVMEKFHIIKHDGTLDVEEMEFFMRKTYDLLSQVICDCATIATGDRCSLIKSFQDCVLERTIGDTVL